MVRFLPVTDLWPTLKKLARATKMRRFVAVGYVGPKGATHLPFRRNDVLICPLTEAHARNRSVCPATLKTLQKRGVNVYRWDDLHAKAFLFGRTSVVGSPNLCTNSCDNLDEAALMTTDRQVARQLRQWFKDRMAEEPDAAWLAKCRKTYDASPVPVPDKKGQFGPRMWLVKVRSQDYPEAESAAYEAGRRKARKALDKPKRNSVEPIRWRGSKRFIASLQANDFIVEVFDGGNGPLQVCPSGRLLNRKTIKKTGGALVTYLYVQMPKEYRMIKWVLFKRECATVGLKLQSSFTTRRVSKRTHIMRIQSVVSPEKLAK